MTRPGLRRLMPLLNGRERLVVERLMEIQPADGGATAAAIQRGIGMHIRNVQQVVRQLCDLGVLERLGHGEISLVADLRAAIGPLEQRRLAPRGNGSP